jgi:hypothetical protein
MKPFALSLLSLVLCGCSSFHDDSYEAELKARYRAQRVETVAKSLISEGKAADMTEAKPLAEKIVAREITEQKDADHDNEHEANFFKEGDKRAE